MDSNLAGKLACKQLVRGTQSKNVNNVCILGNILALGGSVDPDPVHVVPILSILFVSSGFMYPI